MSNESNATNALEGVLDLLARVMVSDDYGATVYAAAGDEILETSYHDYAVKHFGCTDADFKFDEETGECLATSSWTPFAEYADLVREDRREDLDEIKCEVLRALGANPPPEENAAAVLKSALDIIRKNDDAHAGGHDGPFYIAKIRSFFGPREELSFAHDERGERIEFDSVADARAWIGNSESETCILANGESSRPEYIVIGQPVMDWIDMDDGSKFDWDGCECRRDAGVPCGQCEDCCSMMERQGIAYIREHAIENV